MMMKRKLGRAREEGGFREGRQTRIGRERMIKKTKKIR